MVISEDIGNLRCEREEGHSEGGKKHTQLVRLRAPKASYKKRCPNSSILSKSDSRPVQV